MTNEEWGVSATQAANELKACKTADDVREVWRKNLTLGHKTLGRLLLGSDIEKMLAKREEKG